MCSFIHFLLSFRSVNEKKKSIASFLIAQLHAPTIVGRKLSLYLYMYLLAKTLARLTLVQARLCPHRPHITFHERAHFSRRSISLIHRNLYGTPQKCKVLSSGVCFSFM